jgi:hypothetical protein
MIAHSLRRSLFLHLAPGVPFTLAFLLAAWWMPRVGGSTYLALTICIPLVLAPCELAVLIIERKRLGWSWRALIAPRGRPRFLLLDLLFSVAALYVIAELAAALANPLRTLLLRAAAVWLPPWSILDVPQGLPPGVLWLSLLLSGLVAPLVEELYFRAYLLPRLPVAGRWVPAVNAALFALYHFYSPWNCLTIFLASLPLAYYVRLRGNILPTILTHMLFNSVGIIILLAGYPLPTFGP